MYVLFINYLTSAFMGNSFLKFLTALHIFPGHTAVTSTSGPSSRKRSEEERLTILRQYFVQKLSHVCLFSRQQIGVWEKLLSNST